MGNKISCTLLSLISFLTYIPVIICNEVSLTVEILPGKTDCFYHTVKKEKDFEIEFQVIEGGDLDINFFVTDPSERVLAAQMKKTESTNNISAKSLGDYKICFDNSYSTFSRKVVYFTVLDVHDEAQNENLFKFHAENANSGKEALEMRLEDFDRAVTSVYDRLDRAIKYQELIKNYEARDRNIQEANFERVNYFSLLQLIIMVIVGSVQVFVIRRFFSDGSGPSPIKIRT